MNGAFSAKKPMKVPIGLALGVVPLVLGAAILALLLVPQRAAAHDPVIHDPLAPKPDPVVAPMAPVTAGTPADRCKATAGSTHQCAHPC